MEKIRFWIRKTFGFSQKETNGFLLLSFLIILTVLAPAVFNYFYQLSVENNSQKDKEMLNQLIRDWKGSRRQKTDIELKKKACVAFNPNMANEKELTDLLGKQASRNILKYRSKGGRFRSADELKKSAVLTAIW